MNAIGTDEVIRLLEVLRESKIDVFNLELPPFRLQANRYVKSRDRAGGQESDSLVSLMAPALGFVRFARSPGEAPFAEVDRVVEKGAILCMIDVLGELNAVKADCPCRVREITVPDGRMVEFDQQIMLLEKIEHE